MNKQLNVSREDALDILFANRNRAYGAYQIRRQYPATLARALGIGLFFIALMVALPHIMQAFSGLMPLEEPAEKEYIITDVNLQPPPPKPPTPSTPPPATRSTQRFVPPVVEEDKKVAEEPPKISTDDLLKNPAEIGKTNVTVPEDGPPTIAPAGPGGPVETHLPVDDDPVELFDVQIPPSFPGGESELMRYLAKNIQYPDMAREANVQGVVVVSFVVGKDGSINDVAVLKDLGAGCGKEATRVLKTMPKWSPGQSNGHSVKVRFTLPVRFKLQ